MRQRYWARSVIGWERFRHAAPNEGHRALATLEARGVLAGIITQNVDRLHRKAGSREVVELHGALEDVTCLGCGALEHRDALQARLLSRNPTWARLHATSAPDGDADLPSELVERFDVAACAHCDGVLKPRVVFFGENVARHIVDRAFALVDSAELLVIAGSSLAVFSGYRFLLRAAERNIPIAIVNRGPVRGEERAALKLEDATGAVLPELADRLAAT
jgi:NAD-dependent SIR2 family protein deacetylase